MTTVYLGTGGYTNPDWCGLLYPATAKKTDFLRYYSQHYRCVELNASFYVIPGEKSFAGMARNSEGRVRFCVKLHQDFTHTLTADADLAQRMLLSPNPLREADLFVAYLAQFPFSFPRTAANRRHLAKLFDWFADQPLAVEFRHPSWHIPKVIQDFKHLGLIWCSVDYPNLSSLPNSQLIITQRIGYLRLHGNNTQAWWDGKTAAERHDYCYQDDEMAAWAHTIHAQRTYFDSLYVLFQNTTKGYAIGNIAMLRQHLVQLGLDVH